MLDMDNDVEDVMGVGVVMMVMMMVMIDKQSRQPSAPDMVTRGLIW